MPGTTAIASRGHAALDAASLANPVNSSHGMDRRRHRAGRAAAWRILRHRRTADARAMAGISAWCAAARARGCGRCCSPATASPRCGGRGSTSISAITPSKARGCARPPLLASSHAVYGVTHLASLARLLPERDPHEDIYEMLDRTLDDFDDVGERGRASDPVRTGDAGRTRLRPRSGKLRRDRRDHRTDLRLAEIRRRGVAGGRRALARPAAAAAGVPARRRGRRERLVGPGPAGRFSADRAVPAAPCAGAARAGPFRRPRRVYQRGDAKSGANQFGGLPRSASSLRMRTIRRGPSMACGQPFLPQTLWLWVCVRRDDDCPIRVLPDSPQKFNASPWENDSYRRKNRPKSTRSCCAMRSKSAISPMRSRPSCTAPCRTPATG